MTYNIFYFNRDCVCVQYFEILPRGHKKVMSLKNLKGEMNLDVRM